MSAIWMSDHVDPANPDGGKDILCEDCEKPIDDCKCYSVFDLSEIDNIKFEDIDFNDYPDFCDAFICSADYKGVEMTEDQLNDLNENYGDFVKDSLMSHLY